MYNDAPVRKVFRTNYERIMDMNEEELAHEIWELAKQIKLLKLESEANIEYWLKQDVKQ